MHYNGQRFVIKQYFILQYFIFLFYTFPDFTGLSNSLHLLGRNVLIIKNSKILSSFRLQHVCAGILVTIATSAVPEAISVQTRLVNATRENAKVASSIVTAKNVLRRVRRVSTVDVIRTLACVYRRVRLGFMARGVIKNVTRDALSANS